MSEDEINRQIKILESALEDSTEEEEIDFFKSEIKKLRAKLKKQRFNNKNH